MSTQKSTKTPEKIIEKNGRRYREVERKSALPFWGAAAVWLIAALAVPMTGMLHIAGIALVSLAVGMLITKIAPRETKLVELPFYEGNNDLNHVAGEIADAREAFLAARDKIAAKKPETAARLTAIEATCGKIQAAVLASPDDLPKIRRFLNYYLPVTRKLADKYNLVFIDLQAAWDELFKHMHPCNIAWDRIHPNQTGCMYIAKQFLEATGFSLTH